MIRTYIVEMNKTDVMQYFYNLYDAKEYLRSTGYDDRLSIWAIYGPSFGEGYHKYRLFFSGSKNGKDVFKRLSL